MSEETPLKMEHLSSRELRPCDFCGGALVPMFHVVDVRLACIDERAAQQLTGMDQYFGGKSLKLAELFTPRSNQIASILDEPANRTRVFCCNNCFPGVLGRIDLAAHEQRKREDKATAEADKARAEAKA